MTNETNLVKKDWEPTQKQRDFVTAYLQDEEEERRVERAAALSGVSARQAYRWLQNPSFKSFVNTEIHRVCVPKWTLTAWNAFQRELTRDKPNPRVLIKAADMLRLMLGLWERRDGGPEPLDDATRLALGAGLDRIRQLMHQDQAAGGRAPVQAEYELGQDGGAGDEDMAVDDDDRLAGEGEGEGEGATNQDGQGEGGRPPMPPASRD